MSQVTKSAKNNIEVLSANGLSTFVDDTDGVLKLKDTNGVVQPITDYTGNVNGEVIVQGTGICSSLRCGVNNTASGAFSGSLGGQNNCALGAFSVVLGGCANYTNQKDSFISHGNGNTIASSCNFGGDYEPSGSFIIGGQQNCLNSSGCLGDYIIGGICNGISVCSNSEGGNNIIGGYGNKICTEYGIETTCSIYSSSYVSIQNSVGSCICSYYNQPCSNGIGYNSITNSSDSRIQIIDCTTNSCYNTSSLYNTGLKIDNSYSSSICAFACGCTLPLGGSLIQQSEISGSVNSNMRIFYNLPATDCGDVSSANLQFLNNKLLNATCSCIYVKNSRCSCTVFNSVSGQYNCISVEQPNILNINYQRAVQNSILSGSGNTIYALNTGDGASIWGSEIVQNYILAGASSRIGACTDGITESAYSSINLIGNAVQGLIMNSNFSTILSGFCNTIQLNTAYGYISQGCCNCIDYGCYSFIGNGCNNRARNLSPSCFQFIGSGGSNLVCSNYSTVLNGCTNQATNTFASVFAGQSNISCGVFSSVNGGIQNRVTSCWGTIINGQCNCVTIGRGSTIINGFRQCATQACSLIGTGNVNCATNAFSSVINGANNCANGCYSFVNTGSFNTGNGSFAVVSGGCANKALGDYSSITNGFNNCAIGLYSGIYNGSSNCATDCFISIANGCKNEASGAYGFIGSGICNRIYKNAVNQLGFGSSIVNGCCNCVTMTYSAIVSGQNNRITGCCYGFVGVSGNSTITSNFGAILNGSGHNITGIYSAVSSGNANTISGDYSSINNGFCNTISGISSLIGNGNCNNVSSNLSSVVGGVFNCINSCYGFIGGGCQNKTAGIYSSVLNGSGNCANDSYSSVLSGLANKITSTSTFSTILGSNASCAVFAPSSLISGGCLNVITGRSNFLGAMNASTILNGLCNSICNVFDAPGQGYNLVHGCANIALNSYNTIFGASNCATACHSGVFGQNNIASCVYSYIAGCGITSRMACAFHANRYVATNLPSSATGLPSGAFWYDPADGNSVKYVP